MMRNEPVATANVKHAGVSGNYASDFQCHVESATYFAPAPFASPAALQA
jgi:hypothetical protein